MLTYLLIQIYNSAFDCLSLSAGNIFSMCRSTDGHLIVLHHSATCINLLYFCFIYLFMHLSSLLDYKLPDGRNCLISPIFTYPGISAKFPTKSNHSINFVGGRVGENAQVERKKEERKEGCNFKLWSNVCTCLLTIFWNNNTHRREIELLAT